MVAVCARRVVCILNKSKFKENQKQTVHSFHLALPFCASLINIHVSDSSTVDKNTFFRKAIDFPIVFFESICCGAFVE